MTEARIPKPRLIACLVVLHLVVSWPFPWEEGSLLVALLRPNPDLWGLLAIASLLVLRFGERRFVSHPVALLLLFVPLYRFGSTVMPVFYGKDLDLYHDTLMVPGLVHLLLHPYPGWLQLIFALVAVAVVVGLYLVFHCVVRSAVRAGSNRAWCGWLCGLGLALGAVGALQAAVTDAESPRLWAKTMSVPLVRDSQTAVSSWRARSEYAEVIATAEVESTGRTGDLSRLGGIDVYVLFIESYGMSLFRKPETLARYREWMPGWQDSLRADGYEVVSVIGRPAIRGGSSSMAHAQFLTGVPVANRRQFDALLASEVVALPEYFSRAGYRSLNVQPATDLEEWVEGKFFGFEADLFMPYFPYDGTRYHWGIVPDQFALARLLEGEVRPAERPLFVQYVSVTSHAPFNKIPPYYEDWSAAARSESFAGDPAREYPINWLNYATHPEVKDAFLDTIRYSLDTMVGFIAQLERPSLVLILGDHQPPRVQDMYAHDRTFDVPIHLLSNRPELLVPFRALESRDGFVPDPEGRPYETSSFLPFFLFAYGE